jgi:hypothetical protein
MNEPASSPENQMRRSPSQIYQTVSAEPDEREPFRISFSECLPIICNVGLALIGLVLLPSQPGVGLVTFTFFGMGGFLLGWLKWQQYREHKLSPTAVDVVGGVRIKPTKFMAGMGLGLAVVGYVMFLFGDSYPALLQWLGALFAALGTVVFVLGMMGTFPPGFLQFEPDGLIIGRRGWQVLVPWDRIYAIEQSSMDSNSVITLDILDHDTLEITPASMEVAARKIIAGRSLWQWTPFKIFPMHYGIPTPVLALAIRHYAENATARRALASRKLPAHPTPK